jgi:hypothetical protein
MSQQPFDPASRAERALAVEEERLARLTNTRVAYGDVVDPPATGRWAKPQQNPDPSRLYPMQPPTSPWSQDVGLEPPYPGDINYVEVCGTDEEAERAANLLAAAAGLLGDSGTDVDPPSSDSADQPPDPLPVAPLGSGSLSSTAAEAPISFTWQAPDPLPDAADASVGRSDRRDERRGSGSTPWRRFG